MKKQVIVTADRGETRVAILEAEGNPSPKEATKQKDPNWRVGELYIERRGSRSIVGNIYKGKVDNVLPGLEAAFVDIGLEKNGFLHADDVVIPGVEVARRGRTGGKGKRITELLKPGQEILVQAVKDPLKTKGPRLSMQLSIAGRYLVYVPQGEGVGVSRRLDDKERERLRKEAKGLDIGEGGAIIRTAAQGATKADFQREIAYLHKLHEVLQKRAEEAAAPAMVFQEADLAVRVVRDIFSKQFERAIVDDPKQHHRLESFFTRTAPELLDRLELYNDDKHPLFEQLRHRGGDPVDAEAPGGPPVGRLPADRVHRGDDGDRHQLGLLHRPRQGRAARGHDHQDQPRGGRGGRGPAEAARHRRDHRHRLHRHEPRAQPRRGAEGAAQGARRGPHEDLRGRDLTAGPGGDDPPERDRRRARDPHQDLPDLRRRGRGALRGDGGDRRRAQAARAGRRTARGRRRSWSSSTRAWPSLLAGGPGRPLLEIEAETGKHFHFEGSEALPIDHFAVSMEGSLEEIEQRALPFQEGEEVLVTIEEPHMYTEDDAVAKLDGYVISVTGAGRLLGKKTLVRIEKVGRSAASASLVEGAEVVDAAPAAATKDGSDDAKKPRRRGRRGGRGRRKNATEGATSD